MIHDDRLVAFARELGCVADELLLDDVGGDDRELVGRPLRGADERDAPVDGVEQRRARAAATEVQHAQLAAAVGELERDPGIGDEVDAEHRRGGSAIRGRRRDRDDRRTRRDSRARPRGRARVARARGRVGRRTPPARGGPSSACARRASAEIRFETANRTSADWLALRLPPVCSRCSRRRHISSARRSIDARDAGRRRLRRPRVARYPPPATTPGKPRRRRGPVGTLARMRIAIGGDHAGYPLKQHLVGVLQTWGHAVDRPRHRQHRAGRLPAVSAPPWRARS